MTLHYPRKDWDLVTLVGVCSPLMAFDINDAILKRRGRITCPKFSIPTLRNRHFFSLSVLAGLRRSVSTSRRWPICLCRDLEKITMSSKFTRENFHVTMERMTSTLHRSAQGRCVAQTACEWTDIFRDVRWTRFCRNLLPRFLLSRIRYLRLKWKRLRFCWESWYIRPYVISNMSLVLWGRIGLDNRRKSAMLHLFSQRRLFV